MKVLDWSEISLSAPSKELSARKPAHHGNRAIKGWKKKILRRYRKRAQKFRDEAKSPEQKVAWDTVIEWMNSALRVRFEDERISWMEKNRQ